MSSYNGGYRAFTTTDEDHGGIALVVTTLLGTYAVLCCAIRILTRFTATGPIGKDDLCCMIGTVRTNSEHLEPGGLLANDDQILGTAQTITAGVAIRSGFGKDYGLLTSVDVLRTRQALFAAELLYLLANAAAKCSVALLFARLFSQKSHIKVCYGLAAIGAA